MRMPNMDDKMLAPVSFRLIIGLLLDLKKAPNEVSPSFTLG
jgi:hypothetical protein